MPLCNVFENRKMSQSRLENRKFSTYRLLKPIHKRLSILLKFLNGILCWKIFDTSFLSSTITRVARTALKFDGEGPIFSDISSSITFKYETMFKKYLSLKFSCTTKFLDRKHSVENFFYRPTPFNSGDIQKINFPPPT